MKGPGWGVPEDILKLLPGQAFEIEQSLDDKGLPCEKPVPKKKKAGKRSLSRPLNRVMQHCSLCGQLHTTVCVL